VPAATTPRGPRPTVLPWLLGAAGVLSQIAWVLVPDGWRDAMTITSVLLMAAAGAVHAGLYRGWRWSVALYGATMAIGLAVEAVGTATGFPFGDYRYGPRLGPMLLDVPLLIPLAWCMAAYPMLLMARRLATSRAAVSLIGAWTITAWDLFLDPQMVGEGHWTFANPTPALPGSPGIPLTNYAGWFATGLVIFWVLDHLPRAAADDRMPAVLLLWMYASNVLAAAVFFGRPAVAVWGGIAMGLTVLPWARLVLPELRAGLSRPSGQAPPGRTTDTPAPGPAGSSPVP
jgi:uncharacterized membrane protein